MRHCCVGCLKHDLHALAAAPPNGRRSHIYCCLSIFACNALEPFSHTNKSLKAVSKMGFLRASFRQIFLPIDQSKFRTSFEYILRISKYYFHCRTIIGQKMIHLDIFQLCSAARIILYIFKYNKGTQMFICIFIYTNQSNVQWCGYADLSTKTPCYYYLYNLLLLHLNFIGLDRPFDSDRTLNSCIVHRCVVCWAWCNYSKSTHLSCWYCLAALLQRYGQSNK